MRDSHKGIPVLNKSSSSWFNRSWNELITCTEREIVSCSKKPAQRIPASTQNSEMKRTIIISARECKPKADVAANDKPNVLNRM